MDYDTFWIDWWSIKQRLSLRYWWGKFWWRWVPGIDIEVAWPCGLLSVDHNDPRWYDVGAVWVEIESADPNDHYRPFMEECIGRQGWDWNWDIRHNNAAENRLTIRIRKKHAIFATHIAIMWS